mgnify:CR=1 FL=1
MVIFSMVLFCLLTPVTSAEDPLVVIVQALKTSPVYVAPGTEGTDGNTAGKLLARFTQDDFIVLVMLPASAGKEIGPDINTFATRIYNELNDGRTVGLSVGRKVVGYSPRLPAGVAADLMVRADNVSNDSVTAIGTYLQNVRRWLKENPQPTPTPLPILPQSGENGWSWLLWVVLVIIVTIIVILYRMLQSTPNPDGLVVNFNVPGPIKSLLVKVTTDGQLVHDVELKQKLGKLRVDLEWYFKKCCSDEKRDAYFFKDRLKEAIRVLTKYRDAQDDPRYYNDPEEVMGMGKTALLDFCEYVLQSIKNGNDVALFGYKVDTRILGVHRLISQGVGLLDALDSKKKK